MIRRAGEAPVRHEGKRGRVESGSMPKGASDRAQARRPRPDATESARGTGPARRRGRATLDLWTWHRARKRPVDRAAVECVGAWDDEKSITNERSARTFRSFAIFDVGASARLECQRLGHAERRSEDKPHATSPSAPLTDGCSVSLPARVRLRAAPRPRAPRGPRFAPPRRRRAA